MLGIAAISVGATAGVLLPGQGDEAIAAESSLSAPSLAAESLEAPQVLSVEPDAALEPGVVVEPEVVEAIATPAIGPSLVKHRVEDGDTLWALAQSYGVPAEAIAASNSIDANAVLTVGQTLKIPTTIAARPAASDESAVVVQPDATAEPAAAEAASEAPESTAVMLPAWQEATARNAAEAARSTQTYSVQPGDTLSAIADQFAVSSVELAQLNDIDDPRRLQPGQRLKLPAEASLPVAAQPSQAATPEASPARAVAARPTFAGDSHIEKLKDEVMQMRAQFRIRNERLAAEEPVAPSPAAEVASRPDAPVLLAPTAVPAARVEPPAPAPTAERPVEFERPRAIAAAPVPSEAYNRLLQLPSGRTVAPELPPLQGPERYLPDRPQQFNGYIWPTRGTLTSGYGPRWGRMHRGIDIAAPTGTPIFAAASGEVVAAGWNNGGYGNLVDIRHPDGSMTRYAHNSRILVRKGQRVEQGEQIALMGSTGFSTGPHLHFEVHPSGRGAMNPMAFLPRR